MATQKILSFNAATGEMVETEIPLTAPDVAVLKDQKKTEIKNAFLQAFNLGKEISGLSVGTIKLDCRREDLDNMRTLLSSMQRNAIATTTVRDFSNTDHPNVTVADVEAIISDLEDYGMFLYGKKFALDQATDAVTQEQMVDARDAVVDAARGALDSANALPEDTDEEKEAKAVAVASAQDALDRAELDYSVAFAGIVW